MKDRIQTVYKELCSTLKEMSAKQRYYLTLMGMNRTLCICSRLVGYDFFREIGRLTEFMENNRREIFGHTQDYHGHEELRDLFAQFSEQWEDFLGSGWKESRDAVLTGCSDEFMTQWYSFPGVIRASFEYYTPERMAGYVTLPLRCLDGYLRDEVFYHGGCTDDEQLQAFINGHEAIEKETERIAVDIQTVLNSDSETVYARICSYSRLDIFEGLEETPWG